MKAKWMLTTVLALGLLLILVAGIGAAQGRTSGKGVTPQSAMGTAFTYQGLLTDGGSSANGIYDLEFKLYDAASGGNQVGRTVAKDDVTVTDGFITLELDFGGSAFNGEARWLDIGVRPGDSAGAYTLLSPRQALTPAPYAFHAAGAAEGDCWALRGNAGTNPSINFLGTTDGQTLAINPNGGNVGIGIKSPTSRLHIVGQENNGTTAALRVTSGAQSMLIDGNELDALVDGLHLNYNSHGKVIMGGKVGIGTTQPQGLLHVSAGTSGDARLVLEADTDNNKEDDQPMLVLAQDGGLVTAQIGFDKGENDLKIRTNSEVEIYANLQIYDPSTDDMVVELGVGLDYAEGFDVSDEIEAVPGTVLVIDPHHPGKLAVSREPYDAKVAGIVAGANGLGSGVRLGADQFDLDVALAGRVYCNVDATYGQVSPGDLLTTSPTPGYAMRVVDYGRAQGAILGKAMGRLEEGQKGQLLVLVTLQ